MATLGSGEDDGTDADGLLCKDGRAEEATTRGRGEIYDSKQISTKKTEDMVVVLSVIKMLPKGKFSSTSVHAPML
jgi:hypothetical protein